MVFIKKLEFETEKNTLEIDFEKFGVSSSNFSVIVGQNGVGKTAVIEAIISTFSNRYRSDSSNYILKSRVKLENGIEHFFPLKKDEAKREMAEEKKYKPDKISDTLCKIVISSYSPFDRILQKYPSSNGDTKERKGKDIVPIVYPENNVDNVQALASTACFKNLLNGNDSVVEEVCRVVGLDASSVLFYVGKIANVRWEQLVNRIFELGEYERNIFNGLIGRRSNLLDFEVDKLPSSKSSKVIDYMDKINKRKRLAKNLKEIYCRHLLVLADIKELFIYGKRVYSNKMHGKQFQSIENIYESYRSRYTKIDSNKIKEIINIDIALLDLIQIYMISFISAEKNGARIWLDKLSSGEFSFFTRLLEISADLENNSIVLIDEPETHLNPKWVYEFIFLLKKLFNNKNSHFIILSQSPFIVGSAAREEITILKLAKIISENNRPREASKNDVSDTSNHEIPNNHREADLYKNDSKVDESTGKSEKVIVKRAEAETLGALFDEILESVFDIRPRDNLVVNDYIKMISEEKNQDIVNAIRMIDVLAPSREKSKIIMDLFTDETIHLVEEHLENFCKGDNNDE